MPRPPPRSRNSSFTPISASSFAIPTITSAAFANGTTSRICEPMWQWIPTGFTCLQASASLYAAGICSCGIPNLLVASPVAIFGWVGTSSAGLTRNEISATFPAFAAMASSWWSSSRESSETFTPWLTARARSVGVFELPLKSSFAAGIPASRARASSPAEKISAPAPSRARARITARFPFAFAAKRTCTFSYRLESAAWYAVKCSQIRSSLVT